MNREIIVLVGLCFSLFVFGAVLLIAFHRGETDFFGVLVRGMGTAVPALAVGTFLGYLGLTIYEGVGEGGEKNDRGHDDESVENGGAR